MRSLAVLLRYAAARRIISLALGAAFLAASNLAVDTSCTAPPHCPAGQHAQRAPSHQGHMWDCVPDGAS